MSIITPTHKRGAPAELPDFRPGPVRPSLGASEVAYAIAESLYEMERHQNTDRPSVGSAMLKRGRVEDRSLAEHLHDVLATAKVMTAQVAMHIDREWQQRLFAQLDDLLDVDDWHEDDVPIKETSFRTFLRMIIYQAPGRRPGLGVSHRGNLIAAWTSGTDRLTLEFLPGDMVRWVLSCEIDGEHERAAGDTPVRRLPEVMSAYRPDRWFSDAKRQNPT